jgi:hypothetical protein
MVVFPLFYLFTAATQKDHPVDGLKTIQWRVLWKLSQIFRQSTVQWTLFALQVLDSSDAVQNGVHGTSDLSRGVLILIKFYLQTQDSAI